MTTTSFRNLDGLFLPRGVAVVGASQKVSFVSNILANLRRWNFAGGVFPVNPKYAEIDGVPCHPTVASIPASVDLAFIGVEGGRVAEVLDDCERAGVRGIVVVSSGFGEIDTEEGHRREKFVRDWSRRTGVPLVGPNCLGLMNGHTGLVGFPTPFLTMRPGGVSAVLQSGMLAPSLLMPLLAREIGLHQIVSIGNESVVSAADYVAYMAQQAETKVIACYLEQIRDPSEFADACAIAADRKKPIIAIKVGKSTGARRAALAHTGSLVGPDATVDAYFRKHGIVRVDCIDELIETIGIGLSPRLPRGDNVAFVSPSGGASSLVSDLAEKFRVPLPILSDASAKALKPVVPAFGSVANPLDITGQSVFDDSILDRSLDILASSGDYDVIMWGRDFAAGIDPESPVAKSVVRAQAQFPDVLFLVASIVGGQIFDSLRPTAPLQNRVAALNGIPFLQGSDNALLAVRHLCAYARFQRNRNRQQALAARAAVPRLQHGDLPSRMTEREAKAVLAAFGMSVTREYLAKDAAAAVAHAQSIAGLVAMKIESPDIAHKTEAKGVFLNVRGDDAIRTSFGQIVENARAYKADAEINGVLIQEMAPKGVEFFIGMTQDPKFGPTVAIGLGGIFVELFADVQTLLPPFDEIEVREALLRLKGYPLLVGLRGAEPSDVDALVDTILKFGDLVQEIGRQVAEIDINPLVVLSQGNGVRVVDALFVKDQLS
jgi:acetate---CoA ligase (ADP-forming)